MPLLRSLNFVPFGAESQDADDLDKKTNNPAEGTKIRAIWNVEAASCRLDYPVESGKMPLLRSLIPPEKTRPSGSRYFPREEDV